MKKLLSLLIILSSVFTVSISAKEIDMKGNEFGAYNTFISGDIIKNVSVDKQDSYGFESADGRLYYNAFSNDAYLFSKVGNNENVLSQFYVRNYNSKAFTAKDNSYSNFEIPTYYGDKIYWMFQDKSTRLRNIGYLKTSPANISDETSAAISFSNFYPGITIPSMEIVCDNDNINVGETAHCTLYFKYGDYLETQINNLFDMSIDLDLKSEDHEISNIKIGKYTDLTVKDNHISGSVLDYDKIEDYAFKMMEEYEFDSFEEIMGSLGEDIKSDYVCKDTYPSLDSTLLPKDELALELETSSIPNCYYRVDRTIKLLSFDITSNGNGSEGIIKLSDVQVIIDSDEVDVDPMVLYENEEEETTIPIIGLVKGVEEVEENPKTGLFNYIMLIIPVSLFIYGLFLLKKRTSFKGV